MASKKESARDGGYIVTWAEIANVLNVCEKTARNWGKRGLPVQWCEGFVVIHRQVLREWLGNRPNSKHKGM